MKKKILYYNFVCNLSSLFLEPGIHHVGSRVFVLHIPQHSSNHIGERETLIWGRSFALVNCSLSLVIGYKSARYHFRLFPVAHTTVTYTWTCDYFYWLNCNL